MMHQGDIKKSWNITIKRKHYYIMLEWWLILLVTKLKVMLISIAVLIPWRGGISVRVINIITTHWDFFAIYSQVSPQYVIFIFEYVFWFVFYYLYYILNLTKSQGNLVIFRRVIKKIVIGYYMAFLKFLFMI